MKSKIIFFKKYKFKQTLIKTILKILPEFIRYKIIRSSIELNYKPNKRLTFKIAETKEELIEAFKLLHDAYVQSGYMNPHPSGMRITKYHALPETTTLIALWDKEVVGTVSIIRRTSLGLPLEAIFDITFQLKECNKPAEISALAIRSDFRKKRGEILFLLIKFLHAYCKEYFGIDLMVFAINPKGLDYYKSILCCHTLQKHGVQNYSYVNNAPAVGVYVFLENAYKDYIFHYYKKKDNKNYFKFLMEADIPNFIFPERSFHTISDPVMTPELLNFFFIEQSNVISSLRKKEYMHFRELYNNDIYKKILPKYELITTSKRSNLRRYSVNCPGIVLDGSKKIKMKVYNVSAKGLGAQINGSLDFSKTYKIKVEVAEFEILTLVVRPIWKKLDVTYYGFELLVQNLNWNIFIHYLEKRFLLMGTAEFKKYKKIS